MHLPDYVEARAVLVPATEYLRQAITAATAQTELTGDLLVTVSRHQLLRDDRALAPNADPG